MFLFVMPLQSLALFIIGNISFRRFAFYVIAQLLGAIAASAVLLGILPGPLLVNTQRASNVGIAQALFWGESGDFAFFLTFSPPYHRSIL